MRCVTLTFPYYSPPALTPDVTSKAILDLHEDARFVLAWQYWKFQKGRLRLFERDNLVNNVKLTSQLIQELEADYPWLNSPNLDLSDLTAPIRS
jgi:hypothetical protein